MDNFDRSNNVKGGGQQKFGPQTATNRGAGLEFVNPKPPTDIFAPNQNNSNQSDIQASSEKNVNTEKSIKDKHPKLKLFFIVLLILIVIGGVFMVGWFVGYTKGKSDGKKSTRQTSELNNPEASKVDVKELPLKGTASSLKLEPLKDPEFKEELLKAGPGVQVESSDGFVLLVTDVERGFKPNDPGYEVPANKELIKVNFIMGNITKSKTLSLNTFSFRLEDSKNRQITPEVIEDFSGKFDTVQIEPGKNQTGSIIYAVNKSEKPLSFTRTQVYRITNQNREVTTKTSIIITEDN